MLRRKIEGYCTYELDRLIQANAPICAVLTQMRDASSDLLLRAALDDQLEVNHRLLGALQECNDSLRREPRDVRHLALDALLRQGESALAIEDPVVRDLVLATCNLRILYWSLAGCASLASMWRQLDQPRLGVELERSVYLLTGTREQIEWMLDKLLSRGLDRATPEMVQRHQIPVPREVGLV
ncbi:MAG: DUF892 family protein [Proteobacteria bacterium]|nr:DUF892 family protein [Pseudomonadota bacterium]